jgi:hypothetical protein
MFLLFAADFSCGASAGSSVSFLSAFFLRAVLFGVSHPTFDNAQALFKIPVRQHSELEFEFLDALARFFARLYDGPIRPRERRLFWLR